MTSETPRGRVMRPRVERMLSIHARTTHFGSPAERRVSESGVLPMSARPGGAGGARGRSHPLALACFPVSACVARYPADTIRTPVSVRKCIRAL